jgi:hypothetical protein
MITPGLRRALHEALDHVLDAVAEDERAANGTTGKKARRYRAPYVPTPEQLARITPEVRAQADAALARAEARGRRR